MLKTCPKCKNNKDLSEFSTQKKRGKIVPKSRCKSCVREDDNIRYHKYKDKHKERKSKQNKNYQNKHKDIIKEKESIRNKTEIRKNTFKKYRNKNRESANEYLKNYNKQKRKINPVFKISDCIRASINGGFKAKKHLKTSKTQKMLGCSFLELKIYLESKFESWMNWDNHGKYNGELNFGWDIDHIIPLSSAKTEEELIKLNHHTNLQPLCSKINRDIKRGINPLL